MGQVVTLSERAFDMEPGYILEGINGDWIPPRRERFERNLWSIICWVVGHALYETNEYRKMKQPFTLQDAYHADVPPSLAYDMLVLLMHPRYLTRPVLCCRRCRKVMR